MRGKRSFWIGLGVGMMAGALLLQLMNAGQAQSATWAGVESGTSDPGGGESAVYTQEEADLLVQAAVDKALREQEAESGPEGASPESGHQPSPSPLNTGSGADGAPSSPSPSPAPAAKPSPAKQDSSSKKAENSSANGKTIIVRIPPNSNLTSVGKLLESSGVVEQGEDFVAYMQKGGSPGTVRAGYFSFKGSQDLAAVKKIVTGQPMDPDEAKKRIGSGG
ncbi:MULTISPECIES: hypothetical protein [unclassified Paenibacillus]|uniref:hypothetical protein n=1 Tax=unclassified Paenibacillus TaxID=185978 RepID=UPI0009556F65|nr:MULTISPECIES: hypothetical protein [unclassified Paenibacillus]ASS65689.1 endolytic transglycosylase MltG [Paenibacillus sp. RUD330]SIQ27214.1 hypothetical protein SAMN05880555_1221 [Paenibacillus sp. RU4X]SIQ49404.1 hypothetical protein SAMN05880570_1220 [Paenibacillus sp. RU4T]